MHQLESDGWLTRKNLDKPRQRIKWWVLSRAIIQLRATFRGATTDTLLDLTEISRASIIPRYDADSLSLLGNASSSCHKRPQRYK